MRVLHTSDWHVGKQLRGRSRLDEHRAVLDEIAGIAARERAEIILVVGDLFESMAPPADAVAVVWDALLALRETGAHVVVVGGNHDQQAQLESVAPVFERLGITVLGLPAERKRAVVRVGDAQIVMLPWVSQRWAVRSEQLMGASAAETVQYYAARIARLLEWLCAGFSVDTANIVAAHCMVRGGRLGGGERDAQLIDEYAVPSAAFPAAANYVALGHLHRMQRIDGAAPIWYSGSPIQVDFGEEHDVKHVLLADIPDHGATKVTPVPLTRGWTLRTVRGSLADLDAFARTSGDAWLRVEVRERPRPGLADDVRTLLPRAIDVLVRPPTNERVESEHHMERTGSPRELFGAYLESVNRAPDKQLLALFDELLDESTEAAEAS